MRLMVNLPRHAHIISWSESGLVIAESFYRQAFAHLERKAVECFLGSVIPGKVISDWYGP
jgi:hypothetical protein